MRQPSQEPRLAWQTNELETPLLAVERQLDALRQALCTQDSTTIDRVAAQLHTALAIAVDQFGRAARAGGVPPPLRKRLALAGGQVAAQREVLARATATLDRTIDLLLPSLSAGGQTGNACAEGNA